MKTNSADSKSSIRIFFIFIFLLLNYPIFVNGQRLNYENLNFSEALAKAKKTHQLVFIQLGSECKQCDSVAVKGLSGKEVNQVYEKFICIKTEQNTDDYKKIISDYRLKPNYPSSLFIDPHGNYLAAMLNKSTSNPFEYVKLALTATAAEKNPPFKIYTDAISKNKADKNLLKEYITKLIDANLEIGDLAEKYAGALTLKELVDSTELKFLIRTTPLLNSNLYRLLHTNVELYSKVFESFPKEERIRINQKIIRLSKEKAFKEKDRNLMHAISYYIRGTYGKDYKTGNKAASFFEMEFYETIKDSMMYYNHAKNYYQNYIQNLKIDSVCNAELNQMVKRADGAIMKGGRLYYTGNQLNRMAFTIQKLTSDKEQLGFGLKLSEQTLRYNYPPYIDTYAQILYKLGAKKDAMDWQKKAVDLSEKMYMPNESYKEVLLKMNNDSL
jgi:hypothetical protein